MYRLVLLSHVLGAILAVGPAFTYGLWLALGRRAGEREQAFAFRGVLWIDARLVTPAFVWLLVSGLLLVFVYRSARFGTLWLDLSLMIYVVLAILAVTVVAPRARRARRALDEHGIDAPGYVGYRKLMRRLSPVISVGTLAIVYLMVTKPT